MRTHELSVESPLGRLRLVEADGALVGVWFPEDGEDWDGWDGDGAGRSPAAERGADAGGAGRPGGRRDGHPILETAQSQLAEYFAGKRKGFDLPLAPRGTPFQQAVWKALLAIPYGETRSYGAIARAVGRPTAFRAVGAANGRNPLAIVVPCHRVIGADGSLTGYGGGEDRKRWLLAHEGAGRHALESTMFPRSPA